MTPQRDSSSQSGGRQPETVRIGMAHFGGAPGLVAGTTIGCGLGREAIDTPLSDTLLLTPL